MNNNRTERSLSDGDVEGTTFFLDLKEIDIGMIPV